MYLYISANDFQYDCTRLAKKVYDDPTWQPDLILALWRGGAFPGTVISEVFAFLGRAIPHTIIKCASYTTIATRENGVSFEGADAVLESITPGTRVLVVDDVFDTGKTAEAIRNRLSHIDHRIATVYWKPNASLVPFAPDYYLRQTDDWIIFPHELEGLTPDALRAKDPTLAEILLS